MKFLQLDVTHLISTTVILLLQFIIPSSSQECISFSSTNKTETPNFWCSVTADVKIQNLCTTSVTESILLPWSTGRLTRMLPHQTNQKILRVKSYVSFPAEENELPGEAITPANTEVISQMGDINTEIRVVIPISTTPVSVSIRYIVVPGVVEFSQCEDDIETTKFPNLDDSDNTTERLYMLTRWAMGGLSVRLVNFIKVSFILSSAAQYEGILDVALFKNDGFSINTSSSSTSEESDEETKVTIAGITSGLTTAQIIVYARTWKAAMDSSCATERDCFGEYALLKESEVKQSPIGLIILGVVGSATLVTIVIGVYCWVRKVRGDDNTSSAELQEQGSEQLPQSLHHFAYDTGDADEACSFRSSPKTITPQSASGAFPFAEKK